jgi:signal transduction histidine kinase
LPLRLPLSRISFRWQIILLGAVAAVLLLAVLVATIAALRYTKSAVLNDEKRRLVEATRELAREYSNKAHFEEQNKEAAPLENPNAEPSRAVLELLSRVVLQNTEEVEGGFYSRALDGLVGDSFPTLEERGEKLNKGDISTEPYAAILQVARSATDSHQPSEQVLTGGNDTIIIEAVPIRDGQEFAGSAWTAKRLSGLPGSNRFRAYLIAVGLGTAALACVLLTLLVVRNLQNGVRKIEAGLEGLEGNLASQIPAEADPHEIRQIARAINRLGMALKEKIESEKQIEDRLRHAERLAALGRLVAGVAHEVRNPLATIRLRVQMCQQDVESPGIQESCAVALEEIERLNGMVNRLLSFSRPVQLHTEPINLRRLLELRLASFHDAASQHRVRMITDFSNGSVLLQLDQSRMTQVFDNIIQNAIEAMPEAGGTLCVSMAYEKGAATDMQGVSVEFNDTGKGISLEAIGRVFDPFFTTKSSGTGLGLSICHELVRAHGGEIHVVSAEGRGTTVRIVLPLREADRSSGSA